MTGPDMDEIARRIKAEPRLYPTPKGPTKYVNAAKTDQKGSGPWVVYFETESPKTIHRWHYKSKGEATRVAEAEQKKRGGFVTVMRSGVEVASFPS